MLQKLAEDRARLVELHSQILELARAFATQVQRSVVKERLDTYKYPVLTLPNEVVAEILVQFIPKYPACPPPGSLHSPLLLTRICRLWREIAHATPKLWRAVSLSSRSRISPNPKNIWLNRAGCFPLAIRMNEVAGYTVDESSLIAVIVPYRPRCEYLELRRLDQYVPYLPRIEGEFPLLKHLDLELDQKPDVKIEFSRVPMLRSAVLDVVAAHSVVLPWSQSTTLSSHTISLEDCVPVLGKVTDLSECKLLTCRLMNTFLDSFTLPLLSRLDVCEDLLGPDPISSLTTFVSRSECKLQYLRISSMKSDSANSYSAAFPSIREVIFGKHKEEVYSELPRYTTNR
ncbi:F-box domain-containing protein [Favolaschia claudopus]|uniref:F-box domain-containing protein n=1 Tax=Favolaschia claudopus TaxID=2862362 RepID=A0AAV9ZW79_9AGAR